MESPSYRIGLLYNDDHGDTLLQLPQGYIFRLLRQTLHNLAGYTILVRNRPIIADAATSRLHHAIPAER